MKYQAIFFDLDGTLLPMDNDRFTLGYFHLLAQTAAPYGYEEKALVSALWQGVEAVSYTHLDVYKRQPCFSVKIL